MDESCFVSDIGHSTLLPTTSLTSLSCAVRPCLQTNLAEQRLEAESFIRTSQFKFDKLLDSYLALRQEHESLLTVLADLQDQACPAPPGSASQCDCVGGSNSCDGSCSAASQCEGDIMDNCYVKVIAHDCISQTSLVHGLSG